MNTLEDTITSLFFLGKDVPHLKTTHSLCKNLELDRLEQIYFIGSPGEGYVSQSVVRELHGPPVEPDIIRNRQRCVQLLMDLDDASFSALEEAAMTMRKVHSSSSEEDPFLLKCIYFSARNIHHVFDVLQQYLPTTAPYADISNMINELDRKTQLSSLLNKYKNMCEGSIIVSYSPNREKLTYTNVLGEERTIKPEDLGKDFHNSFYKKLRDDVVPDAISFVEALKDSFCYYMAIAKFGKELKKNGLCCFPEIGDDHGSAVVTGFYNPLLGIRKSMLFAQPGSQGSILNYSPEICAHDYRASGDTIHTILGRNKGAKTTYIVGRGILQLMTQIGSPIPATSAQIGCVEEMGSVFLAEVSIGAGQSTFSHALEECGNMFKIVTGDRGLLLLDDATEGTDPKNSYEYMDFIIEKIRETGSTAFISTQQQRLYREEPRPQRVAFYTTVPGGYAIQPLNGRDEPEHINWREIAQETALSEFL